MEMRARKTKARGKAVSRPPLAVVEKVPAKADKKTDKRELEAKAKAVAPVAVSPAHAVNSAGATKAVAGAKSAPTSGGKAAPAPAAGKDAPVAVAAEETEAPEPTAEPAEEP